LKIHFRKDEKGSQILCLEGDLDFQTSPELRSQLATVAEKQPPRILVDLAKVPYIDSSGLATFVELFQKMKRHGGKLVLFNLSQTVRSVFEIAKLDTIFHLAASEADALAISE